MPAGKMLVAFSTVAGTTPTFSSKKGVCRYSQDQNIPATMSVRSLFSKLEKVTKNTPQSFIRRIKPLK